jgi:transposase
MADEGYQYREIARVLLVDENTVNIHVREYKESKKLAINYSSGRPSKFTKEQAEEIIAHLNKITCTKSEDICSYIKGKYGITFTQNGLARWLNDHGFVYKKPKTVINLRRAERALSLGLLFFLFGCSSLHKETDPELVRLETSFLVDSKFDPNKKFFFSETLLHREANRKFQKPNLKVMQKLIDRGANVNAKDDYGQTPLHVCRDLKAAKLLIKNGAKLDAVNNGGFTPLEAICQEAERLSVFEGDDIDWIVDVVEFLIQQGAKFSEKFKLSNFKCKRLAVLVLKHGGAKALEYTREVGDYPTSLAAQ